MCDEGEFPNTGLLDPGGGVFSKINPLGVPAQEPIR